MEVKISNNYDASHHCQIEKNSSLSSALESGHSMNEKREGYQGRNNDRELCKTKINEWACI